MTNEVLESLRVCAAEGPCTNCHEKIGRKCISNLTMKAADAIENLQTENAALRRQIDNLTSAQAMMVKEFDKKLSEMEVMRNELCLKCGNYREAHNGAYNGCRWKAALAGKGHNNHA